MPKLTRREFMVGAIGNLLHSKKEDTTKRLQELEASLINQGEASFMRDEALLALIDPKMGITYYGTILRDFAKGDE